jgi:spore coat polysaccharide biosynthesis predicted glycosyltransferase SpsG
MRKEYWNIKSRKTNRLMSSILITFGGDDIRNLTPKVLTFLNKEFPDVNKKVVIGKGFHNQKMIKRVANSNTDLIYYPNSKKMVSLMTECDLAISAGGQTINELAKAGLPAIIIVIAKNQIGQVNQWQKVGFIESSGWYKQPNLLKKLKININELYNYKARKIKSKIGMRILKKSAENNLISKVLRELK